MMGRTHHSNCRSCEKTVDTIDAVQLLHSDHFPSALPFLQKQSKSKSKAKAKERKSLASGFDHALQGGGGGGLA